MENKITVEDFKDYVEGWLMSCGDMEDLSIEEMRSALKNSLAMLEDNQDGIDHFVSRWKQINGSF